MSAGTAPVVDACRADPAFPAIKEMVVSRTGMAFYRNRDEALARAVGARIAALALPCCDAYRRHLLDAGNRAEWDTLVDHLTNGHRQHSVEGTSGSVCVDLGSCHILNKNNK